MKKLLLILFFLPLIGCFDVIEPGKKGVDFKPFEGEYNTGDVTQKHDTLNVERIKIQTH